VGRVSTNSTELEACVVPIVFVLPLGAINTLDIELDILLSRVVFIFGCADVIGLTAVIFAVGITGLEVMVGIFAWTVLVAAISGFVVIGTTDDEGSREDDFAISDFWVVDGVGVGVGV
jgi:hypothetical protein